MALLVAVSFLSAQESWHFQNPIPTSSVLKSVCFVDPDTGWAAGAEGTIICTKDGGSTWHLQQAADADHIGQVFFLDSRTGWAIGSRETGEYDWGGIAVHEVILLKTNDGGFHWLVQANHGPQFSGYGKFGRIFFADSKTGWLTGGVLLDGTSSRMLKTTNGGETWFPQGDSSGQIGCLFFVDSLTGWGIRHLSYYQAEILRTTDGGENWIGHVVRVNGGLESLFFIDKETGWAVGVDNYIYKTTNGGNDWFRQSISGNISNCQLTSVCFTDALNGFIAGWLVYLTTKDGGGTWVVEQYQSGPSILSICFANHDIGWRVGEGGSIEKTTDGGVTWKYQSQTFTSDELLAVEFVDQYSGWVLSPWSIFHTSDCGFNWQKQYSVPFTPGLNHLCFVNPVSGWAVGWEYVPGTKAVILHTSDGGNHWERQPTDKRAALNAVCFIDQNAGWAVGDSGTILFTSDGGAHWNQRESGTTVTLTSVGFVDQYHGWIGGQGVVLRTDDAGTQWHPYTYDGPALLSLHFVDSLLGWAVGGSCSPENLCSGSIMHSSDGGRSWEEQFRETDVIIRSVNFVNATNGWAVGSKVWFTEDGGKNWIRRNVPIWWTNAVDFVNSSYGWLVGPVGTIMHTSDGGVTFVERGTPEGTPLMPLLHQNFPNPFNPTTTIRYSLPDARNVTLTVFNTLGQHIVELVNGTNDAGHHEVRFDGAGLSSGVYFYRLQAGDFVQSRRLMLLK